MGEDTFVKSITHLKDRPNGDHALDLLKKTASLVKPIMRKHGWVLPELSEFYPDNPNLLGLSEYQYSNPRQRGFTTQVADVNGGQKIMIRLRPHGSRWFYDLEEIVGTMIHELTHNVHGDHDERFYKFMGELQEEYYALRRSGYAGEGFHSNGHRLGGCSNVRANPQAVRAKALEAAEKRASKSRVLGGATRSRPLNGNRFTSTPISNMSPAELAASAAERRARDSMQCGSQQGRELAARESAKAKREGITNQVIDLTMEDELWEPDWISENEEDDEVIIVKDVHPTPPSSKGKGKGPMNQTSVRSSTGSKVTGRKLGGPVANIPASSKQWSCQTCTLINSPSALECAACTIRRPQDDSVGWRCWTCGETGNEHTFWSCRVCGEIKVSS